MAVTNLQERLISGRGVLKIDPLTDIAYRQYLLYINVERRPTNESLNFNYNPSQSFYATVTFWRYGYVVDTRSIRYPSELWTFYPDCGGQGLIAQKCALDATFESFANLVIAVGQVPISITNPIADYTVMPIGWDELKVVCFADSAVRLKLVAIDYDSCQEGYGSPTATGEPPEPSAGTVPPGSPLTGANSPSEPYEGESDGGDTVPYPGDGVPSSDPCENLVWWHITYTTAPVVVEGDLYFKAQPDDVLTIVRVAEPGCVDGERTDLNVNGVTGINTFACSVYLDTYDISQLGTGEEPPPGADTATLEPYAECP